MVDEWNVVEEAHDWATRLVAFDKAPTEQELTAFCTWFVLDPSRPRMFIDAVTLLRYEQLSGQVGGDKSSCAEPSLQLSSGTAPMLGSRAWVVMKLEEVRNLVVSILERWPEIYLPRSGMAELPKLTREGCTPWFNTCRAALAIWTPYAALLMIRTNLNSVQQELSEPGGSAAMKEELASRRGRGGRSDH